MKRIPTPQEAAEAAGARYRAAREGLTSASTEAEMLHAARLGNEAARARAVARNAELTPEQRRAGVEAGRTIESRAQRLFAGRENKKGRSRWIVLSQGQFQEWNAGGPVSGLPEGVVLAPKGERRGV